MSYVSTEKIQAWLEESKFPVISVNPVFEETAVNLIFAELAQRYDTTTWISTATTPPIVLNVIAMQIAAFEYRAAVSQEDGADSYADELEVRLNKVVCAIASGALPLPDSFPIDSTSSIGGGPGFFPTDASTALMEWDEGATPMRFSMTMDF